MTKTIQTTSIFVVNGNMVVADTMIEAIKIFCDKNPDCEPRKVEQLYQGRDEYDALILKDKDEYGRTI